MSRGRSDLGAKLVAAARNLAVDGTAMEVVRAFNAAGVRCIVLKGPTLGAWLYGPEPSRYSLDVDLLVASGTRVGAEDVLHELGYEPLMPAVHPTDRPRYARAWRRDSDSADVDLHTTIAGVGVPSDEAWSVLAGETEEIDIGRVRAEVLAPGARALHVALHAAKHGAAQHSQPLQDLERALQQLSLDVWQEAAALAVRLDAVPAFVTSFALVPEGGELVRRLGLSAKPSVEVVLRAQTAPALSLGVEWFSRLPGVRAKAHFLVDKIAPPAAFMRSWHPLARRGRLGLVAAYAYRPVWLLLKLGPALAVWRRAKKASAGTR